MTGQRMLTEPEAWREIARRIVEGDWCRHGLCAEIEELLINGALASGVFLDMRRRIRGAADLSPNRWRANDGCAWFAFPMGAQPEARAMAALFFALEAEDEVASTRLAAEIQEGR